MYSDDEVKFLLDEYAVNKDIAALAAKLNKTPRSIIGKLSRLGVYEKKQYVSKTGERPVTKLEYCARIARVLELNVEGLEKAPKEVLKQIAIKLEEGQ
jgi:hypothetical protein